MCSIAGYNCTPSALIPENALSNAVVLLAAAARLVQHPFCKFVTCWFCEAESVAAMRARSAQRTERRTAQSRGGPAFAAGLPAAIAEIKAKMAMYGITLEDLGGKAKAARGRKPKLAKAAKPAKPAKNKAKPAGQNAHARGSGSQVPQPRNRRNLARSRPAVNVDQGDGSRRTQAGRVSGGAVVLVPAFELGGAVAGAGVASSGLKT
jgi:hypothetical protein